MLALYAVDDMEYVEDESGSDGEGACAMDLSDVAARRVPLESWIGDLGLDVEHRLCAGGYPPGEWFLFLQEHADGECSERFPNVVLRCSNNVVQPWPGTACG